MTVHSSRVMRAFSSTVLPSCFQVMRLVFGVGVTHACLSGEGVGIGVGASHARLLQHCLALLISG